MPRYVNIDDLNLNDYATTWKCDCSQHGEQIVMAIDDLNYLPTADVQEDRHAQWWDATPPRFYACSYCGGAGHSIYKFCPWCGAEMDGGGKDSGN